jgi:hypothetical protein
LIAKNILVGAGYRGASGHKDCQTLHVALKYFSMVLVERLVGDKKCNTL